MACGVYVLPVPYVCISDARVVPTGLVEGHLVVNNPTGGESGSKQKQQIVYTAVAAVVVHSRGGSLHSGCMRDPFLGRICRGVS